MIRERGSKINAAGGRGKKRAHCTLQHGNGIRGGGRSAALLALGFFTPVGVDIGDTSSLKGLALD